MGPTPTPGPPPGGLARALARATLPPVSVRSAYAGESRPVVRPAVVEAPVEGATPRLSPVPPVRTPAPEVVTQPGSGLADADSVNEPTPSQTPQPQPQLRSVNEMTPSQVVPSPGQPQPGRESTPPQLPAAEGTHAAALAPTGHPAVGVADSKAVSRDDPAIVQAAAPAVTPPETATDREPVVALEGALVPDLPAQAQIQVAAAVPQARAPDARAAQPADVTPTPEPVAPVVIGRIEVHVDSPAAQPDPFAGCRVVAAGLTARRGGGW